MCNFTNAKPKDLKTYLNLSSIRREVGALKGLNGGYVFDCTINRNNQIQILSQSQRGSQILIQIQMGSQIQTLIQMGSQIQTLIQSQISS